MGQPVLFLGGNMNYPHKYFEDEVREGFFIVGEVKRSWAAQIEVLTEIDRICKKHNIKWFADNGTLLGTIRHKGYIPWDDDLDICMLRDDYFKFKEVAKSELSGGFACLTLTDDDPFYEYLMRVVSGKKFNFEKDYLDKFYDCQFPVGVDIFPLDYVALDDKVEETRKEIALQVMACADSIEKDDPAAEKNFEFKKLVKAVEDLTGARIDKSKPIKQQMFMAAEVLFTLYGSKDAKYVVLMPYWLQHNDHKYPIECFRESVMMPFENIEIPVPVEYDKVLRIEYGDYMQLYKAGGVHGYPFFEQLENLLIEKIDKYYFRYKYNPDDLTDNEREKTLTTKKQVVNFINMTKEAHDAIVLMVSQGKADVACDLLCACQESAINIGNLIEAAYGEGFSAVSILEEYCESVYQLYQALLNGEFGASDAAGIATFLLDIYQRMNDILEKQVINVKEIVFIPYRSDYWPGMEELWKIACQTDDWHVSVVPVPYYKKTARSELADMYYEGEDLPSYVDIIDYKTYDFEKRHPDIIVTQNSFDECNYVMSLGKEHYSRILRKYTDKLVCISPFVIDEIEDEESKAWKTLDYFCAVPGVVRADKVIVQSENMKKTYIKRLTQMAGEETLDIWEDKICSKGLKTWNSLLGIKDNNEADDIDGAAKETVIFGDDKEIAEKEKDISACEIEEKRDLIKSLPKDWQDKIVKPGDDFKKIILYNVSVSSFAQYGEKIIKKIESSLEALKNASDDIAVVWYVNPQLNKTLKRINLTLRDKFGRITEKYKSENWGIYADMADYDLLLKICDAFYGDAGNIPHVLRNGKKPVMIQNIDIV